MTNDCAYKRITPKDELDACKDPGAKDFRGGPEVSLQNGTSYKFFMMLGCPGDKWCNKGVSGQGTFPSILKYDDTPTYQYMFTPLKLESTGAKDEYYIRTMYMCEHNGHVCNKAISFSGQKCPWAVAGTDYQCELAKFGDTPVKFKFTKVSGKPDHFNIVAQNGHAGWQLSTDEDKNCARRPPKITIEHLETDYLWRLVPVV